MLVRLTLANAGSDKGNSTLCAPGVVMTNASDPKLSDPSTRSSCTRVPGPATAAASTARNRTAIEANGVRSALSPAKLLSYPNCE
jgi:hypothetical protein